MGKERKGIIKKCRACDTEFYVPQYRIKTASFCSLTCQNHKQYERFIFSCESCGKLQQAPPSRRKEKKKFCSIECRDIKAKNDKEKRKSQKVLQIARRGNIKAATLRKYISQFKKMECENCGYHAYDFCLDMHHIDHNPTNNAPDNIRILCCICHRMLHKGIIK